jgi:hypothetical protein
MWMYWTEVRPMDVEREKNRIPRADSIE